MFVSFKGFGLTSC